MERNFILGAIVVCAAALAAAMAIKNDRVRDADASGSDPGATRAESALAPTSRSTLEKSGRHPSSPIGERRDDTLLAHVEHKYRYLLADVESAHVEELKRRLLEHEGEASLERKASSDARVTELLSPRERAYFQALKDSDLEQHHVAEYVGGIGNIAPLDTRQEREILDAKLRRKQRHATALRDLGLDRDSLSQTEREYAHTHVTETLRSYLDDFLTEVAPSLTHDQFLLLRNYETTELERELERMQQRINAK